MMAWFTGTATPLILMLIGAPTDMKMSEAFLSSDLWNSRFIADILSPLFLCLPQSPRSSSFRLVLARVFASTFLTMTAQYRPQLLSGEGKLPETTNEPAGARPEGSSPVARARLRVLGPGNTPMEMTLFSSTTTPSTTSERAPMKQLSSMITGFAWIGSSTPPMPTPPEKRTFLALRGPHAHL